MLKSGDINVCQIPNRLKAIGLCLASTAIRIPLPRYALASPTDTSRRSDNPPVFAQHGFTGHFRAKSVRSRPRTFYPIADSRWEPVRSVGKVPVGEPSLFRERKCLSPQADDSTTVQNVQEKRGTACGQRAIPPIPLKQMGLPARLVELCPRALGPVTPSFP